MSESEFMASVPDGISVAPLVQDQAETPQLAVCSLPAIRVGVWRRVFSFPALLGALVVGAVATLAQTFFVDPDVWWHIKFGQVILTTHHWPTVDVYSFSVAGQHWIDPEWFGEVLLAGIYRLGGLRGLDLMFFILGSAILVGLYTLASIRSGNSKAAFVATAAVFVMVTVSFNLRPQMLGYFFLILTLIVLERFRQGNRRAMWALPLLMVIWVNTHGSWIIGLGVIGVYLACGLLQFRLGDVEARRWSPSERLRLATVFVLCACATVMTPYGAALAKIPFKFAFSLPLNIANIFEWLPMPFNSPLGKLFLIAVLGVIAFQVIYRFAWRLEDLALFLFVTVMACLHVRFVLIFVPVFTPILAIVLARWVPRYERSKDRYVLNAVFMTLILGAVIGYFPSQTELRQSARKLYPIDAVEYLNLHPVVGPMYDDYRFGGYLIWARGPEHKVFIDGRGELYEPSGVFADYLEIADIKPGALAMLQRYGFQSCLISPREALSTVLTALPEWQKIYEDDASVLFVRRNTPPVTGTEASGTPQENGDRRRHILGL